MLLFPTAIGSEPLDPTFASTPQMQRTKQGHPATNVVPLVASSRVGHEVIGNFAITFFGSFFIADATGAKVAEADRTDECVLTASFDLDAVQDFRRSWGTFRNRRPALCKTLQTVDGTQVLVG